MQTANEGAIRLKSMDESGELKYGGRAAELPEGLTAKEDPWDRPDGTTYYYLHDFRFKELFAPRNYPDCTDFVVELNGRNWRVQTEINNHGKYYDEFPEEIAMTFTETDEPPTEYKTLKQVPDEHSEGSFRNGWSCDHVGGQPSFIQNSCYAMHEGKLCYPFLTLETGWGDCGNINVFLGFDDNGRPAKIVHECSCC